MMREQDIRKIEKIVLVSAIVLVLIGVAEIIVGYHTKSVGLTADGTDSISDSVISFMVWFGLRISRRQADKKFHFGYYRVETLVSLMVAVLMMAMSLYIIYNAYLRLKNPVELDYPLLGMITLIIGGFISFYLSIIKNRLAKKHNLLSLEADAKTSTKDWTSSFVILTGVFLSYLGFRWGDAIGAFIVSIYIICIAISTIKQASLILIDGFNNPELAVDVKEIIRKYPKVKLKDLKLRMTGPYITGEITLNVDNSMTIEKAYSIKNMIRHEIMKRIEGVKDLTIVAEPESTA
ncbi:cation transporter [Candidatus Woesearchaeota archaeon]|nr:cation transporter [Candidatus Woesearchaeota archaeon]